MIHGITPDGNEMWLNPEYFRVESINDDGTITFTTEPEGFPYE